MGEAAAAAEPSSSSHLKRDKAEEEEQDEAMEWQEYLRSQRSRKGYAQYYRCRPMSLLGKDIAAADYDDGNRVVMPQSALERLSHVEVEYPMVFKIQNAAARQQASHVGVQEFVAAEGFVHVPTHTMARLGIHAGEDADAGQLVLLTSTSLPKATSVKLQPHTSDFLGVKYPKELLEYNFGKYTCMTVGDTITVTEGDMRYLLDVVEAKPADAVSTIETDCEVDFLPPLDYKEPAAAPVLRQAPLKVNASHEERRIAGVGVRMDGKPVQWESSAVFTVGPGEARSVSFRPPQMMGPSAKGGDSNNENVLRFGAGVSMASASKSGKKTDDNESKRFIGQKYSLED